jgi:hypothetical protein
MSPSWNDTTTTPSDSENVPARTEMDRHYVIILVAITGTLAALAIISSIAFCVVRCSRMIPEQEPLMR